MATLRERRDRRDTDRFLGNLGGSAGSRRGLENARSRNWRNPSALRRAGGALRRASGRAAEPRRRGRVEEVRRRAEREQDESRHAGAQKTLHRLSRAL